MITSSESLDIGLDTGLIAAASVLRRTIRRLRFASADLGRTISRCSLAAIVIATAAGCSRPPRTTLEQLVEARRLSADLLVQFGSAADAANRAVMADTDEASMAFAHEAERANDTVEQNSAALEQVLGALSFSDEARLLGEFSRHFTEYRALDRSILELAVENTNVKAQRLAFGPAQDAVDGFRDALAPLTAGNDSGEVGALVAAAVASLRGIQVLQAPHIAEADETAMTRIETRMTAADAETRRTLEKLATAIPPGSRPQLAIAAAALDRFAELNEQIVALSRRNTNVRALALSLGQKRTLIATCEESLRAIQGSLARRGFAATR